MKRALLAVFAFIALAPTLAADAPATTEICRFAALDPENPFRRWLHSQEVLCADARAPVAVPSGMWNVFARADGMVSAAPMLIEGDSARATIAVPPLVPAATLLPRLPEKQTGVVYVPRHGSALPVDGARVAVPAGEPLWLFVLDGANPVAIHPIAPLVAGSERSLDARIGGAGLIVGWIRVPESDRTRLENAAGLAAPRVRAGDRDAAVRELRAGFEFDAALRNRKGVGIVAPLLVETLIKLGRIAEAREICERALTLVPRDPRLLRLKADLDRRPS